MSEVVHYKGLLKEVLRNHGESIEDQCKRLLNNKEIPSYFDSYKEFLLDEYYQEMVFYNGSLYEVVKEEVDPDSDIFKASIKNIEEIEFEVRYYNGGCGFNEAIEEALENIE